MAGICRNGTDSAGGALIASQSTVFANGAAVVVHGDSVTNHAPPIIHAAPTMIAGSFKVFIGGAAVCNAGDLATCGHAASGSSDISVGDSGVSQIIEWGDLVVINEVTGEETTEVNVEIGFIDQNIDTVLGVNAVLRHTFKKPTSTTATPSSTGIRINPESYIPSVSTTPQSVY